MLLSQPTALAQIRATREWSQAALAEKCAVSRTEISAIETGRLVPSVAVALRLAAALGVSVETLFGGRRRGPRDRLGVAAASRRWRGGGQPRSETG